MPLRDHFRSTRGTRLPWESIHGGWMGEIAARLNELLPDDYVALDRMRMDGGLEIDVGVAEEDEGETPIGLNGHGGTALATAKSVYAPPSATGSCPFDIPDIAEIRVFTNRGEGKLVGAIELVSPGNKDRETKREAFIGKCLDYLAAGACLVIVDVVTDRRTNFHNEIVRRIGAPPALELANELHIYAATYRPVIREKTPEIDIWVAPLAIGEDLPTMPLRLLADYFVPVELERTYTDACRKRRLL